MFILTFVGPSYTRVMIYVIFDALNATWIIIQPWKQTHYPQQAKGTPLLHLLNTKFFTIISGFLKRSQETGAERFVGKYSNISFDIKSRTKECTKSWANQRKTWRKLAWRGRAKGREPNLTKGFFTWNKKGPKIKFHAYIVVLPYISSLTSSKCKKLYKKKSTNVLGPSHAWFWSREADCYKAHALIRFLQLIRERVLSKKKPLFSINQLKGN